MAEEVEQQSISYADALKSSLNPDYKPEQAVAEPTTQEPQQAQAAPTFDPISYLKETFGEEYADPEIIKSKITAPAPEPIYKEPEFTNEESRKIYESILAGDRKTVKNYLDKIELAASIPDKSPEEIIKAGWKEEFGLTDSQVERRFNKTYSIADADLLEDEDKAIEQKLLEKQIEKEAGKYKDFFSKYNTEITLPSLDKPVPASTQPVESEEARKADRYAAELNKSLPTDLTKIGYEYADEKSGYKLTGQYELSKDKVKSFNAPISGYEDRYLATRWTRPDGSIDDVRVETDIYFLHNKEEIINSIVADAVHQTRIEEMKRSKNYQAPGTVVQGDFVKTEDQQKKEHYRKYFM